MSKRICSSAGCSKELYRLNKTGLCSVHSQEALGNARRRPTRLCAGCSVPLARQTEGERCARCLGTARVADSFQVDGDKAELSRLSPVNPRSLAELVAACDIDLSEWEVERWVANKWEMGYKDKEGDAHTKPLFQIKAWLKRKTALVDARLEIEELVAQAKAKMPKRTLHLPAKPQGPHMLELSIPDLHLGKLAWNKETGHANYDLKIAERLFDTAVDTLIARTAGFAFERILFPVGNDLLHSDSKQGMTFGGTQLDTDSRYFKAFTTARRAIIAAIEKLRVIAPVHVVMVPGNHDTMSVWHLGDSLECFYHNSTVVTVDNMPRHRKYTRFGNVALMLTHGDKSKAIDWPLLFATEAADMFGATKFREIHTGHLHQTRLIEKNGVRVRISPALCSADAWHSEHGFVGNIRGAEAYVWSKVEGLVSTVFYNVVEG